jgi:hypothetical protein
MTSQSIAYRNSVTLTYSLKGFGAYDTFEVRFYKLSADVTVITVAYVFCRHSISKPH